MIFYFYFYIPVLIWQETPASSKCAQLWSPKPLLGQVDKEFSLPPQFTLSNQIGTVFAALGKPLKSATAPVVHKEKT